MDHPRRINIVGAGNVAWHLARGFAAAGVAIHGVWSRTPGHAQALAAAVGAVAVDSPADIDRSVPTLICVGDGAVAAVADALPCGDALVAHTSGTVPLDALAKHSCRGVFYPLQTFSKDVAVDLSQVPYFTEGNTSDAEAGLALLARTLGVEAHHADSALREQLHVCGVLTSNFTIYLLGVCEDIMRRQGLPMQLLLPLAQATLDKAFAVGAAQAMTGPARRGNTATIERHMQLLDDPAQKAVYRQISQAILNQYHPQLTLQ